ncbi:MAG: Oxidoreductase, Gfo/Idh/MocA family [uncultured Gemmatimonadaceae bacterium]|uniref:Oxidoreductase, Gfo/Idh/MocA family n=1 Tax=uncultured Gemmatimonadaceae bacterium TaxID=246130 RepID=A0A6J4LYA6_9BACT|nr:MAG: Oxidoreductase, Gfo/Idh/MocA family [uncultured Gemmatimonadaceae bacterium]
MRIGVVGAGGLGYHHVRILRDVPGASLVGFVEARESRAAEVAAELGVRAYPSLEAMLDDVDALTVVVPTPAHYAVAKAALERGKHLLIEKPIAASLAEADELLAIARRAGAIVQTGHVERFNRAVRAALPYVDAPRFIESDRLAPFNPRGADVAVVLDLMIHDIDLVRTLVGASVESVQAVGVPVLTPTVDIANARLTFASGAVANITSSRVSKDRFRKIRIFQQSGYLSLDLAQGNGEFYRMRGDLDLAALAKAPASIDAFVERVPLEAPEGEPLRLEFESFVAAVRGERAVAVTGEDGREALAVALQIVREIERSLPALAGRGAPLPGRGA